VILVASAAIIVVLICSVTLFLFPPRAHGPQASIRPPTATSAATATTTAHPIATLPTGNDWTQYRSDVYGTGVNTEQSLATTSVDQLSQQWALTRHPGYYTTPAIVNGVVYVTTGLSLYAYDLRSGATLWHFDAQPEKLGGIHSSVAVDPATHLAFFGTPEARMYAVDIRTGKEKWHTQIGDPDDGAFIWSSPLFVNGRVYIGLASQNDNPCVRGGVFAFDASTGHIVWSHFMVPSGVRGGGVWSSLTADPDAHSIIATTGNPCGDSRVSDADQDAIIALNWDTGATQWRFTAVDVDEADYDFGEGAVILTYQGQKYIVAGNKAGMLYAVKPPKPGGKPTVAWSAKIAAPDNGSNGGGIFEPPTYSNGMLFVAGGAGSGEGCKVGVLHAFHVDTGQLAWRQCTGGTGKVYSPSAAVGDLLFVAHGQDIVAYAIYTGDPIWSAHLGDSAWGGVAISRGFVLIGTVAGALHCFAISS
jgi:outer membrane protein assembly factor BamB